VVEEAQDRIKINNSNKTTGMKVKNRITRKNKFKNKSNKQKRITKKKNKMTGM
jgi:hypothetical protein